MFQELSVKARAPGVCLVISRKSTWSASGRNSAAIRCWRSTCDPPGFQNIRFLVVQRAKKKKALYVCCDAACCLCFLWGLWIPFLAQELFFFLKWSALDVHTDKDWLKAIVSETKDEMRRRENLSSVHSTWDNSAAAQTWQRVHDSSAPLLSVAKISDCKISLSLISSLVW